MCIELEISLLFPEHRTFASNCDLSHLLPKQIKLIIVLQKKKKCTIVNQDIGTREKIIFDQNKCFRS